MVFSYLWSKKLRACVNGGFIFVEIPIGTVLYRYNIKNKKLYIHEGIVDNYGLRTCVNFRDGSMSVRSPRVEDLGVIRTVGHSLWLRERDDKLAIRKFISFEEDKIAELEKKLKTKRELVKYLKTEVSKRSKACSE